MSDGSQIVVFVGGGSGGHLTPLLPVAEQIKKLNSSVKIVHIGQKGDRLNSIVADSPLIDHHYTVPAGKFRRYHKESWLVRIIDVRTFFFNVRDFFRFIRGLFSAWRLLGKLKPIVVFTKGGYVCAPVGLAASWRHIPYVTHDSDAMVSLAHRIIAKRAVAHLTAMDPQLYLPYYTAFKTIQVGVPVRSEFVPVTDVVKQAARQKLGYEPNDKVALVVGGGLGARNINTAVIQGINTLIANKIQVIVLTGHKLEKETKELLDNMGLQENERETIRILPFTDELHVYSAAADVIVTRAGATNMAEFAIQGRACIIVPNPLLAGGHQLKNAEALQQANAVVVVEESNLVSLSATIKDLCEDSERQQQLEQNLSALAQPDAAENIAHEVLRAAEAKE